MSSPGRLFAGWSKGTLDYTAEKVMWVDKTFLEPILQKNLKHPNLEIATLSKQPAVTLGENYTSIAVTMDVTYKENPNEPKVKAHNLKLFLKFLPSETKGTNLVIEKIFKREKLFYEKAWPEMERMKMKLKKEDQKLLIIPKYFSGTRTNVIILDHLGSLDYVVADRLEKLNLDHCKVVMHTLALFHGISIAVSHRGSKCFDEFTSLTRESGGEPFLVNYFTNGLKIIAQEVTKWKGFERFAPKLNELAPKSPELLKKLKEEPSQISALIHGDCWSNNIMFHYPEGENKPPDSVALLDFQVSQWGCPALDLLHFFYISANFDVFKDQLENLTNLYLIKVEETLEQLEIPSSLFSREKFSEDMKNCMLYGPIHTMTNQVSSQSEIGLPVQATSVVDGTAFEENSIWRKILKKPKVINYIKEALRKMEKILNLE